MKNIILYNFLFLLFFGFHSQARAQDAILSQVYSHPIYLNPAFTGKQSDPRLVLNYRSQPLPDASNFSLVSASVDRYINAISGGLGFFVMSENQGGLMWQNQINAAYAYHLQLSRSWNMSLGLQAGYHQLSLRWNNLEFTNPAQTITNPDLIHDLSFASGFVLSNNNFFGGLAAHHLTNINRDAGSAHFNSFKITAHAGYLIEPRRNRQANTLPFEYHITPSLILQHQNNITRINYGVYAGVEQFMAGVWYRQNLNNSGTLIFLMSIEFNNYRIGYSFDHSLSGYTGMTHAVHEISFSIGLVSNKR